MLSEDRKMELDRLLDGDLPDAERVAVQESLESDPEAIEWLADRALLHANLRSSMKRRAIETGTKLYQVQSESVPGTLRRKRHFFTAAAAALALLLTAFFLLKNDSDTTFVTMKQTRNAYWESSDLPTAQGSRLGKGTLHLAEGMATLQFDSGAEVVLEAPASIDLMDAMNCRLNNGTAVSDIPNSALGFRMKTPSADVVDYGTRFAVSVYEGTGETHTQVIEGKVQVEYSDTGKVVELNTGQRNTVKGETLGEATDSENAELETIPVQQYDHGPGWTQLEPVKDAYTGFVSGHNSEVLLCVKHGIDEKNTNRVAYMAFSLETIDSTQIEEAELVLHFAPTGWGLASHVPDATFRVTGLVGDVPDWDLSILHGEFPGTPEEIELGTFSIPQGVQKGRFTIRTPELADFLKKYSSGEITLKVTRDTIESDGGGLVHGFASRRHPVLPAPTLAIRTTANDKE